MFVNIFVRTSVYNSQIILDITVVFNTSKVVICPPCKRVDATPLPFHACLQLPPTDDCKSKTATGITYLPLIQIILKINSKLSGILQIYLQKQDP